MSIFNSKPTTTEPDNLPAGYDDETSRYFVPAERRELYVADAAKPAFSDVLERADWLIRRAAGIEADQEEADRLGRMPQNSLNGRPIRTGPGTPGYEETRRSRAEQLTRDRHEEFVILAAHDLRAEAAERAAQDLEQLERYDADYTRAATCAGCQTVQPSTQPRPIRRMSPETSRQVCDECERRYHALLTEQAMASAEAATLARIRADLPSIHA